MDPIWIVRILFVLILTLCGYWIGEATTRGIEFSAAAFLLSLFIISLEYATRVLSGKKLVLGAAGAFAGLVFSRLFHDTFPKGMFWNEQASLTAFNLLFMYLGVVMALRNADRISLSKLRFFVTSPKDNAMVLDSSVIIDGRVRELYDLGFLSREAVVPSFVVAELQRLADSGDSVKRHNGRKGLENLDELRDASSVPFQLLEKDYPEIPEVDQKLINLARELHATIVTNDFNLGKVARLHQVDTINLNSLAAALRPTLSVGDQLMLTINREGKDPHQGVGYLEDGTMVVVDHARPLIGQTVGIIIVSLMQTNAGRLAFGRLIENRSAESFEPAAPEADAEKKAVGQA